MAETSPAQASRKTGRAAREDVTRRSGANACGCEGRVTESSPYRYVIIAPIAVGEYMHKVLPRSTLRIIDNVGHCPHLSSPSASAAAIEEFLHELT